MPELLEDVHPEFLYVVPILPRRFNGVVMAGCLPHAEGHIGG